MKKITLAEIRREVKALAEENPEFVYEPPGVTSSCMYLDPVTDEGSCLIGQALLRLEVDKDYLRAHNTESATMLDVWASEDAKVWAKKAQDAQDNGLAWKKAVASGDRWLGLSE